MKSRVGYQADSHASLRWYWLSKHKAFLLSSPSDIRLRKNKINSVQHCSQAIILEILPHLYPCGIRASCREHQNEDLHTVSFVNDWVFFCTINTIEIWGVYLDRYYKYNEEKQAEHYCESKSVLKLVRSQHSAATSIIIFLITHNHKF